MLKSILWHFFQIGRVKFKYTGCIIKLFSTTYGRLSYFFVNFWKLEILFLPDQICNLSVQPV